MLVGEVVAQAADLEALPDAADEPGTRPHQELQRGGPDVQRGSGRRQAPMFGHLGCGKGGGGKKSKAMAKHDGWKPPEFKGFL